MPLNTIEQVISALDAMRAWEEKSRIGFFATLYRRITRAVQDGIIQKQFSKCPLMQKLDVTCAERYLDAFNAFQTQGKPSHCWKVAFHAWPESNAHIDLDLGVASAQVSPGERALRNSSLTSTRSLLCGQRRWERWSKDLPRVGLKTETSLITFNIDPARERGVVYRRATGE